MHHVFARGNDRQCVFRDDRDRRDYLAILGGVVRRMEWRCLAFCLMPNHVHLLVETPRANLGAGMQRLQGPYTQRHNARHRRCGHVFQGRFGSVRVTTEAQLWVTVAYIARNPVEAGLCAEPGAWRWSSHEATLGATAPRWLDVARLLWHLSSAGGDPRARYEELTAAI